MKIVQNSSQMADFLDSIPVPLIAVDEKLNVLQANTLIQSITLLPKEQVYGKRIGEGLQCLHHLDHPKGCGHGPSCDKCTVRKILLETFNNGTKSHKTEAALTLGGNGQEQYSTFLVSTTLVHQGQGKMCMLTLDDIHQITIREKKYSDFISHAPLSFMITDRMGYITEVNHTTSQCTGYSKQELLSMNVCDLLRHGGEERTNRAIHTLLTKGYYKEDTEIVSKDGSVKTLSISMIKGEDNSIISFAEDITERKILERTNKKRQKYAEAIIATSPNAIVTLDSENRITGWNKKATQLFHYMEEEVLGKKIDEFIASHDKNIYNDALSFSSRAISGLRVEPTETIRYTKEGDPIHLMVSGSPIIIDGSFEGIVASYTDISRSKQKEREIETLLEEKEHLLHEVHHRIKNHMNTISSIISLRMGGIEDPHIKGVLEGVQTKMRLMQNIYQSLYLGVDMGAVNIFSFLSPLLNDIRVAYIYNQSISITTDIDEIEITSKQSLPVGIIVTELLTNSIKYAFPENGRGEIHLSVHKDQTNPDLLCIEVSDNGRGIPPEIVEQGKYGFGLTLVNGYTVQFDGAMHISTEAGTTVRVELELE